METQRAERLVVTERLIDLFHACARPLLVHSCQQAARAFQYAHGTSSPLPLNRRPGQKGGDRRMDESNSGCGRPDRRLDQKRPAPPNCSHQLHCTACKCGAAPVRALCFCCHKWWYWSGRRSYSALCLSSRGWHQHRHAVSRTLPARPRTFHSAGAIYAKLLRYVTYFLHCHERFTQRGRQLR